ncbi:MAG: NAD(P)H-dependent glycerol-3-phosphate dehydrogenase [Phycisphaerae bacterium]
MTRAVGQHITIIGAGATGTLFASILAKNGHHPILWGRRLEHIQALAEKRENIAYLPGVAIPPQVRFTADDATAFDAGELIICAIPTQFIRATLQRLAAHIPAGVPMISVAKGIENGALLRPTEIITEICGQRRIAALAGPAIAGEIAAGLPTTLVAATTDPALAQWTQQLLSTSYLRIYTNDDVIGVELGGATKNIIAVAAGILDGMRAGINAKASLLTRGLVEISRLGAAMGAQPRTFSGLAGLGDLATTCFSPGSRNRSFGQWIGQGLSHQEALAKMSGVVEGIATTRSVVALARRGHVDMPITQCLYAVLFEGKSPAAGIAELMSRRPRDERSATDIH